MVNFLIISQIIIIIFLLNRFILRMPDDHRIVDLSPGSPDRDWRGWIPLLGKLPEVDGKQPESRSQRRACRVSEVLAIAGCAFILLHRGFTPQALSDLVLLACLIILSAIDYNEMIIEPRVVLAGMMLQLSWLGYYEALTLFPALVSMLVAAGAFYFIGFIYETLRRRQGLGEGDAAVIGLIALWTGWQGLPALVLVASVSGLLIGGMAILISKQSLQNTRIPFAPFLCLGGALVHWGGDWLLLKGLPL